MFNVVVPADVDGSHGGAIPAPRNTTLLFIFKLPSTLYVPGGIYTAVPGDADEMQLLICVALFVAPVGSSPLQETL
jgi:hypothetical protein